ncbi:tyrosine-type recombinase/integrase [Blastochloris tepida]|uniref:Integrase/recombinase n=1 Tax=Blastochloris tepida TaxID=2233851 RepID=A0A348G5T2_9HYPH|nr:site-specific integrase [Blastochloris tepida]BBF94915.1 integrase/recombinase [Blastochloris tepida]
MGTVRLRFVTVDVDRHGNVRYYFRRPGQPKVRLRGVPGSAEFMAGYADALAGVAPTTPPPRRTRKPQAGTLRWLAAEYFASAPFKELGPRTRRVRRAIIEKVCESAGDEPFADITGPVIRKGMDRRADTPEAANSFLKALRHLFAWAVDAGHLAANPARDVKKLRGNPEGWHTWTVEEVRQFEARHPIGSQARLALALLAYTGVRRSDVVKLGRQHVREGRLRFTVTKNQERSPVVVDIPLLPELQAVIDASPAGNLTFLVTIHDKPFTGDGFGNKFRRWCRQAGLPHCSPHGVRKAAATIAAENGATEAQLDAIFGWTGRKMAAHYTAKANRSKLATSAMPMLVPAQSGNGTVPLSPPDADSETKKRGKTRKNNGRR